MKTFCNILCILSVSTCSEPYEMEETIFIPDEKDKNLPAYTEWGYNSFGIVYERMYFFSTRNIVPCKVIYQNGILRFSISGRLAPSYSSYSNNENMTLSISFPVAEPMRVYQDLTVLHKKKIDLSDSSCTVTLTRSGKTEDVSVQTGHFTINRVQLIRIDEKENRAILSGVFELIFWRATIPETMLNGRFDFGISHLFILPQ